LRKKLIRKCRYSLNS